MMVLIFHKFLFKTFLISAFLFLILLKTSIAESFLFSLSTKGIKFGSFEKDPEDESQEEEETTETSEEKEKKVQTIR